MRYVITVDLEPGETPHWWAAAEERPLDACEAVRKQIQQGSGFDLTQALIGAGSAVAEDARQRPDLWRFVK